MNDYEGAYTCLLDIFYGISEIIKQKDSKLFKDIEEEQINYDKAKDAMYDWSLRKNISESGKVNNIAMESRNMEKALNLFHKDLMKGAYLSGILIPRKEKSQMSGVDKFKEKYIKQEINEDEI